MQARCTPHSTFFGLEVARLLLLACVLRALGPLLTTHATQDLEFTIFCTLALEFFLRTSCNIHFPLRRGWRPKRMLIASMMQTTGKPQH